MEKEGIQNSDRGDRKVSLSVAVGAVSSSTHTL